ncbi:MAG: flavodoxin family protein [Candidatus Micrarchaeota archaeon]|nr:flavodoxin family protein [Candidatus Micrarchaeota archaeon]
MTTKKIIAISGSHRDSNTDAILRQVAKGCENEGAQVKLIFLRELKFQQCCGWSDCYYQNYCIVQDNLSPIFNEFDNANGVILATPVYFDNVSGIMKNFMDRSNPYCKPPRYLGKKVALVCVGGASEKSIVKCDEALRSFSFHHRLDIFGTYSAVADYEKEILQKNKSLEEAVEFGKKFASYLK